MISGDRRSGGDQLDNGGPGHDVDGMEKEVHNVLGSARTGLIFTGIREGNPGRDTARRADPTWSNRAGYSIPCAVMLGSVEGGGAARRELTSGLGVGSGSRGVQLCGSCSLCWVFSSSVSLFLFPFFAVL